MKLKEEVGFVKSVRDYLISLEGLPSARVNDIIVSESGLRILVHALSQQTVEGLLLDEGSIKPGEMVIAGHKGIEIPLGLHLTGRVINPLGIAIDGREGLPPGGRQLKLEVGALGIGHRRLISEPLSTKITLIDSLLPIGKGQRQLILGDARSGKSAFLLDLIINQKDSGVICIYAALGKTDIDVKRFAQAIEAAGAADYTIVVAATSNTTAPLIGISPSTALSIAEYFRELGRDVLLILDDLGTHAKYLREIALLSNQIPGRESYPGDIFHAHSQFMERAGCFNEESGSGSITLLPVMEINLDNFTNLIPTNLMSQTDGHILFSSVRHAQGHYPAIDWSRSVTRVGRQTQTHLQKTLGDKIRSLLAKYLELEAYSQFDTELTQESQRTIEKAKVATEFLDQEPGEEIPVSTQILLLSLIFTEFTDKKSLEFIKSNKNKVIQTLKNSPLFENLRNLGDEGREDFETFLEKVRPQLPVLEEVCH